MTHNAKYACPPKTPEELAARTLEEQRARLMTLMTSGVLEIEQPQLGRTQYRNFGELQQALAMLNSMAGVGGATATVIRSVRSSYSSGGGCCCAFNRWGDCL